MRKSRIERMAALEFLRLPRKEQEFRNKQRRIPTARPAVQFEDKRRKEK